MLAVETGHALVTGGVTTLVVLRTVSTIGDAAAMETRESPKAVGG